MKTDNKVKEKTQEELNIELLKEITELEAKIRDVSSDLEELKERKDMLLQEAVDRQIETAGKYKLICKARTIRKIDIAAIESMLSPEDFLSIAHVTLRDAENFLTPQQIESCITKTISSSYKVVSAYQHSKREV